jgi:hypothetical protein
VDTLPRDKWFASQHPTNRFVLMERLAENGVLFMDGATDVCIEGAQKSSADGSVSLEREGIRSRITTQLVVLATGYRKDEGLTRDLSGGGHGAEVRVIGDCADPRDIHWAVHEGYEVGIKA